MSVKLFKYENELNLGMYMPNEIFSEIKQLALDGVVKSKHHQEFIYSYYWLIAYLWRYARYTKHEITQSQIKQWLGYHPTEKRINYLIKKDGVLDKVGLTDSTRNYPIDWTLKDGELSFFMIQSLNSEDQELINQFTSKNYIVKAPMKHLHRDGYGLFNESDDSHLVDAHVFWTCMKNNKLGCSGFYLYGYLKYIQDKSVWLNKTSKFKMANSTLCEHLLWNVDKIIGLTEELVRVGLIKKTSNFVVDLKKKTVNQYEIIQHSFDSHMEL